MTMTVSQDCRTISSHVSLPLS